MSLLQTVKEKLTQAADGSLSTAQRGAIGDQINALMTEFDDISSDTKFNDNALMTATATTFHVGEGSGDTLAVTFGTSTKTTVGESNVSVEAIITDYNDAGLNAGGFTAGEADVTWATLNQNAAKYGISVADGAIKSLAKSIQNVGDNNARLSSKEESLSLAISNTEATRSRIEDADFAKEQMAMMKLQILQQTTMSSFSQANSAPQMVLSLFR